MSRTPEKYFNEVKILKDLPHDYINLTEFDLRIIDTPYFQRLKDIRQLTCQHVYPSARHTRFDHSLGVMELTRRAIHSINCNGRISIAEDTALIYPALEFATCMAALLHDVGHCPFSHLGEKQFESDGSSADGVFDVKKGLVKTLQEEHILESLFPGKGNIDTSDDKAVKDLKLPGSLHEWLSCYLILTVYGKTLVAAAVEIQRDDNHTLVDGDFLEHIVRCIIGLKHPSIEIENKIKNLAIGLINSDALDMDKLDYIMRDSYFTGISVPRIDTKRLFRNTFVSLDYEIVYTSKAVPVLQTIIETRDSLYLWVYNHHTVVYTDFLLYYIFRRLGKNYNAQIKHAAESDANLRNAIFVGALDKEKYFSLKAIKEDMVSDSDVLSMLNTQRKNNETGEIKKLGLDETEEGNRQRALNLVSDWYNRRLLKPWWKTIYEYRSFMERRFQDDPTRKKIERWICGKTSEELAPEFRAMIAKCVIAISKDRFDGEKLRYTDGDFFVVERSNKYYKTASIDLMTIYLKENEISTADGETMDGKYYGKFLSKLFPQRDYAEVYGDNAFYIYSRKFELDQDELLNQSVEEQEKAKKDHDIKCREFYEKIEKIFVTVAAKLGNMSVEEFKEFHKKYDKAPDESVIEFKLTF